MNRENNDSLNQSKENSPTSAEQPQSAGRINAKDIVVLCGLPSGNVHEFALTIPMRAAILDLIVRMHNGMPRLLEQAIEGISVGSPEPKKEEPRIITPPKGILRARR